MDPNKVGDISELRAAVWLSEQGWEVYRNVGCTGLADLVAFDPEGRCHRIDVKTLCPHPSGNGFVYNGLKPEQREAGVRALYVGVDRFLWGEDKPSRGRPRKTLAQPVSDATMCMDS